MEPDNGWTVTAYEDKTTRDKIYNDLSYERTGCTIITRNDVNTIMGTDRWTLAEHPADDGGYDVIRCYN